MSDMKTMYPSAFLGCLFSTFLIILLLIRSVVDGDPPMWTAVGLIPLIYFATSTVAWGIAWIKRNA